MIPKKIHYCWFGGKELPEQAKQCIDSWKKFCPDYEIIRWDESNYDVTKNEYLKKAYESRKWAFVTDYARLEIVYRQGGIYLDTDVELIKNPDTLLANACFMGMEQVGTVATGLGFGAEAGHPFLRENMKAYEEGGFTGKHGEFQPEICVKITTRLLREAGLAGEDRVQDVAGVRIFPVEYFCPLVMGTNRLRITHNTYSIHHYAASWYTGNALVKTIKYRLIPVKVFIKKYILRRTE